MNTDERYRNAIRKIDALIVEATHVSTAAAGRSVPDPAWWACLLYTRLCVTGISLLSLVPGSRFAGRVVDHYDFSAIASLTCNVWECYFVFFYLASMLLRAMSGSPVCMSCSSTTARLD